MSVWQKAGDSKLQTKQEFSGTGFIGLVTGKFNGIYNCSAENQIRVVVTGVGAGNTIVVKGRIRNASAYDTLDTIVGPNAGTTIDISVYDEIVFDCTVYSASGTPTLIASSFFSKAPGPVVPGEANTASNVGVGGVGLFDTKVGVDLQFKNLNSSTGTISVTDDPINKEVDLNFNAGALSHNSLADLTTGDVHTHYTLLAGRAGGQIVNGGTAASENLDLRSTAHATKGAVLTDNLRVQNQLQTLQAVDNASAGNLNDVSTAGTSFIRFTAASSISGFANGVDGKRLTIKNATGSFLTIRRNNTGSAAANRIQIPSIHDYTVGVNGTVSFIYDATDSRWCIEAFEDALVVRSISADDSIAETDKILLVDTTAAVTLTLPTPNNQLKFIIKDVTGLGETNPITLERNASEEIENLAADRLLTGNYGSWTVVSNGTDWFLV